MDKKTAGMILFIVGIILVLLSLFANQLGIGKPGFGYKQLSGTVAGVVLVILGWIWWKGTKPVEVGGKEIKEKV